MIAGAAGPASRIVSAHALFGSRCRQGALRGHTQWHCGDSGREHTVTVVSSASVLKWGCAVQRRRAERACQRPSRRLAHRTWSGTDVWSWQWQSRTALDPGGVCMSNRSRRRRAEVRQVGTDFRALTTGSPLPFTARASGFGKCRMCVGGRERPKCRELGHCSRFP
eukprot:2561623-Rhodomonas_salina.2